MIAETERRVREMDSPGKSVYAVARELSGELGISEFTCRNYLYAKREGYESRKEYKKIFIRRKGFKNEWAYKRYLKNRKPLPTREIRAVLEKPEPEFLKDLRICSPSQIEILAEIFDCPIDRIARDELIQLVNSTAEKKLSEKERRVIFGRFYEEKTMRALASELHVSAMEICYTEREALEKLRLALVAQGVDDFT